MPRMAKLDLLVAHDLGQLRDRIALPQVALADRAGVAQGTVSNFLRGRPIRIEHGQKILAVLGATVKEHATAGRLHESDAAALRALLDGARDQIEGRAAAPVRRGKPGGAMPLDATNLVRRERELTELIERGLRSHPVTMAIEGPPQSGKSTLLRQVEQTARQSGFLVTLFDRSSMSADRQAGQAAAGFFADLAHELAGTWSVAAPATVVSRFDLQAFIRTTRQRRLDLPAVILLDDVSALDEDTRNDVAEMCRDLHNRRDQTKLSWVLVREFTSQRASEWMHKSRGYFSPCVSVSWFARDEVAQLLSSYSDPGLDPSKTAAWLEQFGGQPFLTHVALDLLSAGSAFEAVDGKASARGGQFGAHIEAVKQALGPTLKKLESSGLSELAKDEQEFLTELHVVCRGPAGVAWACPYYERVFSSHQGHGAAGT